MKFRILFVEDDPAQKELFDDALREVAADNKFDFAIEFASTFAEARDKLDLIRIDAALLDMRLKGSKEGGNELADICVKVYGVPAAIISGHTGDFDRQAPAHKMLAVFDKGDLNVYSNAVNWLIRLAPMIEVLGLTRSRIQSLGAEAFYKLVWPRWEAYKSLRDLDSQQLVGIVARQYASHIAEILGLDAADGIKWHPFENYIQPSIMEDRPHTGDIFETQKELWIVLTPQCDMATGKIDTVLLAYCDRSYLAESWKTKIEALAPKQGQEVSNKTLDYFRDLVNQKEPARHFLPPLQDGVPLVVDFKKLKTFPLKDLKLEERVASVASPFLANLTQRFGAYVSRVGQPNIDVLHFRASQPLK